MSDGLFLDGKQIRNGSIPVVKLKDLTDSNVPVDSDSWLRITQPSDLHDAIKKLDEAIFTLHAGTYGTSGLLLGDFVLNGLQTAAQFMVTGLEGTDFNIVSNLDTHTFNIPFASSSASGKLKNTDYEKFITSYEWGNHATAGYSSLGTDGKVLQSQLPDDLVFLVNGKTGIVVLTTGDIAEDGTNFYFTDERARQALSGTNAIIYNPISGIIDLDESLINITSSQISDFQTAVLNTALIGYNGTLGGEVQDGDSILQALGKLNNKIVTIASTSGVTSVNGYVGIVNLTTTDIPEGTNEYFTISKSRNSISGTNAIIYNPTSGIIDLDNSQINITESQISDFGDYATIGHTHLYTEITNFDTGVNNNYNVQLGVTAYNWGNHATQGYAIGTDYYTKIESDGKYSTKGHTHLYTEITNFDTGVNNNSNVQLGVTAYNWGNHATFGYLINVDGLGLASTSFVEQQLTNYYTKIESNSKYSTQGHTHLYTEITNFDTGVNNNSNVQLGVTSYNWGNHSTQGYLKDLNSFTTSDVAEGTNFYFTEGRARQVISIAPTSQNYMQYDSSTGQLSVKNLLITDVTTDSVSATINAFVSSNYVSGDEFQEGDTIILTATVDGTKVYMHNGGTAGNIFDFIEIQKPNLDDAYVRGLFSATSPLNYNNISGNFTIDQANTSTDGYLTSSDWNKFNTAYSWGDHGTVGYITDGVTSVNGVGPIGGNVTITTTNITEGSNQYFTQTRVRNTVLTGYNGTLGGDVIDTDTVLEAFGKLNNKIVNLTTDDITELTNLYFTVDRARQAISGTNAIIYNPVTGIIDLDESLINITESQISDFGSYSTTGHTHTSSEITDFLTAVLNVTLTGFSGTLGGVVLDTDDILTAFDKLQYQISQITGSNVTSVNGLTGNVILTTSEVSEGTNLYFTDGRVSNNSDVQLGVISYNWGNHATFGYLVQSDIDGFATTSWVENNYYNKTQSDAKYALLSHSHTSSQIVDFAPAVRNTTLAGYSANTSGDVVSSDSILEAFGKLQYQIDQIEAGNVTSVNGLTGNVILTTSEVSEGTNLYFTDGRVSNNSDVQLGVTSYNWGNHATQGYAIATDYYTKVESDGKYSTKGHTHISTDITDFNNAVLTTTLTGFNATSFTGDVTDSDTVLIAFGRIQNTLDGIIGTTSGVLSVNGQFGIVNLDTDDIPEGSINLYYTDTRVKNAIDGTNGVDFNITTGIFSLDQTYLFNQGYVRQSGSVLNNQIAIWTTSGYIEGDSNFTWDGSILALVSPSNTALIDFPNQGAQIKADASGNLQIIDNSQISLIIAGSTKLRVETNEVRSRTNTFLEDQLTMDGNATGTFPISASNDGVIFFDSTLDKFMVSENGGAYTKLLLDTTSDLTEGTNFYFTEGRSRNSISGTNAIIYNPITGIIDLDESLINITSSQISDFNTAVSNNSDVQLGVIAYGWGDHATYGYLTSVDGTGLASTSFVEQQLTNYYTKIESDGKYSTKGHTHISTEITDFNSAVLSTTLTGFMGTTPGPVISSDSVLTAFDKIQYQIDENTAKIANIGQVWTFNSATTVTAPSSGRFKFNNTTYASITEMRIHQDTVLGIDFSDIINALDTGSKIYIQGRRSSNRAVLFEVTGTPTDNGTWFVVPITLIDKTASSLSNNAECTFIFHILGNAAPVQSVNGLIGDVVLTTSEVNEGTNLYYTDTRVSANSDVQLGVTAYNWGDHATYGYVDVTGTPSNNQIAIFTDSNTIEGDANLTYNGTTLSITGSDSSTLINFPTQSASIRANADGEIEIIDDTGILFVVNTTTKVDISDTAFTLSDQIVFNGNPTGTFALSNPGEGSIYFDSTDNKFKVSENGTNFVNLVGVQSEDILNTLLTGFNGTLGGVVSDTTSILDAFGILSGQINRKHSWSYSGAINNTGITANQYFARTDSVGINLSPYVIPYDSKLKRIVANSDSTSTWDVVIFKNGVESYRMTLSSQKNKVSPELDIEYIEGDEVEMKLENVSGTVDRPSVTIHFSTISINVDIVDATTKTYVDSTFSTQGHVHLSTDITDFENAVLTTTLTGFSGTIGGSVLATDNVLRAFDKLQYQVDLFSASSVTSVNGFAGVVVLTTSDISEGTNFYYTDARVSANSDVQLGVVSYSWGDHSTQGYMKSADTITEQTSNFSLLTTELNQIYRLNSTSGIICSLPAVTTSEEGYWLKIFKDNSGDVTITANGTDIIADSTGGGSIANTTSTQDWATVYLQVSKAGKWVVISSDGTWVTS